METYNFTIDKNATKQVIIGKLNELKNRDPNDPHGLNKKSLDELKELATSHGITEVEDKDLRTTLTNWLNAEEKFEHDPFKNMKKMLEQKNIDTTGVRTKQQAIKLLLDNF